MRFSFLRPRNKMHKVHPKAIDILAAVKTVGKDADDCYKIMRSKSSQLSRRNYIRAYFAWVEAMCFFLRRLVIENRFQKRVIRAVDVPEYAALSENRYSVTSKGEAVTEPANTRTLDYIGFSLMACSRLFKLGFFIDRGDKHWQNLALAVRIRDRITHPKSQADVSISDDDIKTVEGFSGWFSAYLEILFNEKIKATLRKEAGIAKRTKKGRLLVFDEITFQF
jgi:hypothetical protein